MIEPEKNLSIRKQCELLRVSRSGWYYEPVPDSPEALALMRRIDELHLKFPFFGSRNLARELWSEGWDVGRKRVQGLMRRMELVALAPQPPSTSQPSPEHPVYPYLLRNLAITRVNQVWAADITYIPMAHGFLYLVAIMDWVSRHVLS
jgi:putative transposase